MSSSPEAASSPLIEGLHVAALSAAALGLVVGLGLQDVSWVKLGVSLFLLLPPLRVATSIMDEVRARRFGVAALGLVVLGIILFSRRIS